MADNLTLTVDGAAFAVTLEDTAVARELARGCRSRSR